ncbi:unnamed protein product [Notodromas monacha]|uniref:Titin n=1 Tax=Notodromas monacha TaxID=399045 RepID=A0A7R9BPL2_9CRUS|nr:unnamed protein product [Notodromas monacha]CAG0918476.1 unnamed protein product [Notodromas monacha]
MTIDATTGKTRKRVSGETLVVRQNKLRPGELPQTQYVRRPSISELEDRLNKPSTPLKEVGSTGPPVIVDFQEKYTATEGENGFITITVEGNPAPTWRVHKAGITEIHEGGRYVYLTDGESNTITLAIKKTRPADEDTYKIQVINPHGQDEVEVSLLVSGEKVKEIQKLITCINDQWGGEMDFRAMLKRKKYAKWKDDKEDPNYDLKKVEPEVKPMLKKVEREIHDSRRVKITVEGAVHRLVIVNPQVLDSGKYRVECMGIVSNGHLQVDVKPEVLNTVSYQFHSITEPDPVYHFNTPLPPLFDGFTRKEAVLECQLSSGKAIVHWFKNGERIEDGGKYDISKDVLGNCKLIIKDAVEEDSGEYECHILYQEDEKTICKVTIVERQFKFERPLLHKKAIEKDKVILDCECDSSEAVVRWFKGETEIIEDKRTKFVSEGRKRKLVIKEVKMVDAGQYYCKTNADVTDCEMLVEYANRIKRGLQDQSGYERDVIKLEVEMQDPTAMPEWYFKGEKIIENDRIEIKNLGGGKHQLKILRASMEDTGEWRCETSGVSTACQVQIDKGEKAPEILFEGPIEGPIGKPLNFSIPYSIYGHKQSQVEAKLISPDGKALSMKDVEIVVKDDKVDMRFKKPQRALSGKYIIKLENSQGENSKEVFINMQDVPEPPESLDIQDIFQDRATITWKAPKSDGGSPIIRYLVERQDLGVKGGWHTLHEVPFGEPTKFTCTDLANKKEYKFRIKAVNKLGESEPITHPKVVLAKDPWGDLFIPIHLWPTRNRIRTCCTVVDDSSLKWSFNLSRNVDTRKENHGPSFSNVFINRHVDEPGKPTGLDIADWNKESADLKWDAPENDGGSPITGYIIEFKGKFDKEWQEAMVLDGNATKAKVLGLKEGQTYEFRVKAVNKAGPGEPSDASKPIVAKDRFGNSIFSQIHQTHSLLKPWFITKMESVVIKRGQVVSFDIKYGGEPEPEVIWTKEGESLSSSGDKVNIELYEKNTIIHVRKAVRMDSGKYMLTLKNSSGEVSQSADVVVLDKPSPPEGPLVAEEVRNDHINIKWKKPKDNGGEELKGYIIEKMDMEIGRWVSAGEVQPNQLTFSVTGLTPKKKYKIRVKAVNKEGESEPLETEDSIVAKNPYDEPGAPSTPEIVDYDNKSVKLTWKPPSEDGGRPIEHYVIEVKDKLSGTWQEMAKTEGPKTEVQVNGLKENMVYQFRVRAANKAGIGEPSLPTANHLCKHRNLKPYIDKDTLHDATIKVGRNHTWEADIRGEPPPDVTWFWRDGIALSNTECLKIENTDYHTKFTVSKGKRQDSGKYTIVAENRNGKDSHIVNLVVLGPPSKPRGPLEATDIHDEGCKLKWQKPEDDGGTPIKEYSIEKFDMETGKWMRVGRVPGDRESMDVTGLEKDHEYKFRVTAINNEGDSDPLVLETPIKAKNPYDAPGKPGTPEIVDYDNKSVDLKWEPPKTDGGSPILKYIIEKKDRFKPEWERAMDVNGDVTEAHVEDLIERAEYMFRIIAVNKAGPGPHSEPTKMHMVKHKALKPHIDRTNIKQTTIKAGKSIKFDINIRGEPPPLVTWILKEKEMVSEGTLEIINVDYNTKYVLSDALRKYSGMYKIVAVNQHGRDEADLELVILGAPSRPKGPLEVKDVTAKHCKVKWGKPDDDGGKPIQAYIVEKMEKGTGRWMQAGRAGPEDLEMEVGGLQEGKEYEFRVKAVNEEGESEPLQTDKAVKARNPFDPPDKPGCPEIVDWDVDRSSECHTRVPGLREGHTYLFRVRAVNKAGPSEPSEPTKPHVAKARFLKPWINRDKLKPIIVRCSNAVRYEVDIKGEPPPAVTWKFKNKVVEISADTKVENEDYLTKLILTDTSRKLSGLWTIYAENSSGNPPDKPGCPEIVDWDVDRVDLKWDAPKSNNGAPITSYIVEAKEKLTGSWEEIHISESSECHTRVPGLREGHTYLFRVRAVNKAGPSEPSEPTKPHVAKARFLIPGPPSMPDIVDWDEHMVQLKWDPPNKDGGSPITGYIIEMRDKYGGNFVKAAEVSGNRCQGQVKGLEEGNKYEFRVKAINKAGPGEPSEHTNPHTAKARYLAPRIDRTNLNQVTVKVGQQVVLDVDVIGEPPPEVTWKLRDEKIQSEDQREINNVDYHTKLILFRASRKDSGKYFIHAKNSSGEDTAEVEIIVLGVPGRPLPGERQRLQAFLPTFEFTFFGLLLPPSG